VTSPRAERPPYAKYAFLNAYNLALLGSTFAVAAATQQWWVAALGAGAEGLWMLFAPDSKLLQKVWFDKYHEQQRLEGRVAELERKLLGLPPREADRSRGLQATRDQILTLAQDNPAFTQDLLARELGKLDHLVMSFVDLAGTCTRYSQYLHSVDIGDIEREMRRFETLVERANGPEGVEVAQKNLAVLVMRRDKYAEIAGDLQVARGQLDLIENTFRLLADQIVTMRSPAELGGQLDELIDGVESIRQTARETEKFMVAASR